MRASPGTFLGGAGRTRAPEPGCGTRATGDEVAPHAILTATALLFLAYGLLSRRLARGLVTAPLLGVAAGLATGPLGLGWIEFPMTSGTVATIGELALAV